MKWKQHKLGWTMTWDPGLGGSGWAVFDLNGKPAKLTRAPIASGVLHATRGTWQERVAEMTAKFVAVLDLYDYMKDFVIEMPEMFGDSEKSYASTVRGDLFKLSFLIGSFQHAIIEYGYECPILVHPREWKGQLPKTTVLARVRRALGDPKLRLKDHEGDAWGMGVALQGRL